MKIAAGGVQIQAAQDIDALRPVSSEFKRDLDRESLRENIVNQSNGGSRAKPEELIKAVEQLNKFSSLSNTHLRFEVHDQTKKITVKVLDDQGDLIRQIPAESALKMLEKMRESTGAIIDNYI